MKPLIRVCFVLAAALLLVVSTVPGLNVLAAQDTCYGLNQADCALVKAAYSAASLRKLTAFTMDYDIAVTLTGGATANNVDFKVHGNGPFQIDSASIAQAPTGVNANLLARLDKLVMQNTMTASLTTSKTTMSGNFEFRILNGVLYFQSDKATNGVWKSVDLTTLLQQRGMRNLGLGSATSTMNPVQIAQLVLSVRKLQATPGLIKAARGTDMTIDNQTIAVFTYTVDLPLLFNSPDLLPLLKIALANRRTSATNSTPQVTDAQIQQITTALATTFQNTTLTMTQWVGTTDKLPYGFGFDLKGTLNPKAMGMLAGGGSPGGSNTTPLNLNEHILVKLSAIGTAANVTAPANSTPLNLGSTEAAPTASAEMPQATAMATMEATAAQ